MRVYQMRGQAMEFQLDNVSYRKALLELVNGFGYGLPCSLAHVK